MLYNPKIRESPPVGIVGRANLNSKLPYINSSNVFAVAALNLIFPSMAVGEITECLFQYLSL